MELSLFGRCLSRQKSDVDKLQVTGRQGLPHVAITLDRVQAIQLHLGVGVSKCDPIGNHTGSGPGPGDPITLIMSTLIPESLSLL